MNRAVRILILITVAGLLPLSSASSAQETTSGWALFEYLLGDWVGEGGGQPGQGTGEFSFHPDLQNRILVRRITRLIRPPKTALVSDMTI